MCYFYSALSFYLNDIKIWELVTLWYRTCKGFQLCSLLRLRIVFEKGRGTLSSLFMLLLICDLSVEQLRSDIILRLRLIMLRNCAVVSMLILLCETTYRDICFLTTLISFHSDRFAWLQAVQSSLTFTLAFIWGPHISVKIAAANSRFVFTIFDEGAVTVFLWLTDTRRIDTLVTERGT